MQFEFGTAPVNLPPRKDIVGLIIRTDAQAPSVTQFSSSRRGLPASTTRRPTASSICSPCQNGRNDDGTDSRIAAGT